MKRFIPFVNFIRFAAKCLIVSVSAIFALFLLNRQYQQVMDNPYSDADKFHYLTSSDSKIQLCNIGSSHGEYAFRYDSLEEKYECFNFAMSSQTYNYDYAILSMYRNHFAENCVMFIPVSYFSFNNEVTNEAEEEFLSTKYYSFLSPKYIPHYSPYIDLVTNRLPILSAGEDIAKLFPSLSLRTLAAGSRTVQAAAGDTETTQAPLPAANKNTQSGNADSPQAQAQSGIADSRQAQTQSGNANAQKAQTQPITATAAEFRQKACSRYNRHMRNKQEYFLPERIANLDDILDFCEANGITPILITTPYTNYYYKQVTMEFKKEFREVITAIADRHGINYYDYSEDERFGTHLEYFSDADHLNETGARLFMDILAKEIPEFSAFLSPERVDTL